MGGSAVLAGGLTGRCGLAKVSLQNRTLETPAGENAMGPGEVGEYPSLSPPACATESSELQLQGHQPDFPVTIGGVRTRSGQTGAGGGPVDRGLSLLGSEPPPEPQFLTELFDFLHQPQQETDDLRIQTAHTVQMVYTPEGQ